MGRFIRRQELSCRTKWSILSTLSVTPMRDNVRVRSCGSELCHRSAKLFPYAVLNSFIPEWRRRKSIPLIQRMRSDALDRSRVQPVLSEHAPPHFLCVSEKNFFFVVLGLTTLSLQSRKFITASNLFFESLFCKSSLYVFDLRMITIVVYFLLHQNAHLFICMKQKFLSYFLFPVIYTWISAFLGLM